MTALLIIAIVVAWVCLGIFQFALYDKFFDNNDELERDSVGGLIFVVLIAPLILIFGSMVFGMVAMWKYVLAPIYRLGTLAGGKLR